MFVSQIKQIILKAKARWKCNIIFKRGSMIDRASCFGGGNCIYEDSKIVNSDIGYGTYIAECSAVQSALIGRYCSIGPCVLFAAGKHPTHTFATTHPAFFSLRKQAGFTYVQKGIFDEDACFPGSGKSIIIGNDVWIGASSTILSGVQIGNGAIIAAGTTVYKDVQPYQMIE